MMLFLFIVLPLLLALWGTVGVLRYRLRAGCWREDRRAPSDAQLRKFKSEQRLYKLEQKLARQIAAERGGEAPHG